MMTDVLTANPYFTIILAAFLLNVFFGYVREGSQKFSAKWFFWIHASIPFLIYLRLTLHTSKLFIPVAIFYAIIGQIIGSRYRRKKMTREDREKMEQIGSLNFPAQPGKFSDSDVTVVLMNMGGPQNIAEVKPFLRRLFMDDLIIRFPLSKWLQPFFAWLIVALRGSVTEKRYGLMGGGSPILRSTLNQKEALAKELSNRGRNINVEICFNYSDPLPPETILKIKRSGRQCILPLSLYPHYSAATTGSNLHYLKKEAARNFPQAVFLESNPYYLGDNYINAFVDRIEAQVKNGESLSDFYILFSAHGLPLYFLTQGDPYPFQIAQTISRVLLKLNRSKRWAVSYQSAVGPLQWLKPSTEGMIQALAHREVKKLLVVPISFVTDHIETICEIDIEYRDVAERLGIRDFRMSKALECHPSFITALADCVDNSLVAANKIGVK